MKQKSLLSSLFSFTEKPKGVLCERCLKNDCGCHEDFMNQTNSNYIPDLDRITEDYEYDYDISDINNIPANNKGVRTAFAESTIMSLLGASKFSEFIFSTNPSTNKFLYDASFSEKIFSTTTPYGGYGSAAAQSDALKAAMSQQISKIQSNPIYAATVQKAIETGYNQLPSNVAAGRTYTSSPRTNPYTTNVVNTGAPENYIMNQEPNPKSTPYGGFENLEQQETAERNLLTLMKQKYPNEFIGLSDEIYMKLTEPAGAQTPIIGKGQVNAAREALGLSPINVVVTTTGGKNGQEPYTNLRGDFESLFPKQTSQLIKIGQDLTGLGQKMTEIDMRENADVKGIYDESARYRKDFLEPKLVDHDTKLTDLGKAVTDASVGTISLLGIPSKYIEIIGLGVGVVALLLSLRK